MKKLLVYLLLFCYSLSARSLNRYGFTNYSIDEGLSNSSVADIIQDNNGFIWVATSEGLNRFDSYGFEQYRMDENDTASLPSNFIFTLCLTRTGKLWIGSRNGISCYNETTNKFDNYLQNSSSYYVTKIHELNDSVLLIVDRYALSLFNIKTKKFIRKTIFPQKNTGIHSSLLLSQSKVLLGTTKGLYEYELYLNQLRKSVPLLGNQRINCLLHSKNGLWAGTENDGLYKLDFRLNIVKNIRNQPEKGICSNSVRCLSYDNKSNLWIGTVFGVSVLNSTENSITLYQHNELDIESLSQNSVRCIFPDNQGGIWLGTYYGGVNYLNPLKNKFMKLKNLPFGYGLNDKIISAICEVANGEIWIGTNDNGINIYNMSTDKYTYVNTSHHKFSKLLSNNIKLIYPVSASAAYIGTSKGGLALVDKIKGVIRYWNNVNSKLNSETVLSMLNLTNRKYWVGTLNGLREFDGNDFFEIPDKHLQLITKQKKISTLFKDSKGFIWVGMFDGFIRYSPQTGKIIDFKNHPDYNSRRQSISAFTEDRNGKIWIATSNGILIFEDENRALKKLTTLNGLANDFVYGIIPNGNEMWITTNNGLSCYNITNSNFRNFYTIDGLLSNQFNEYAFCKTASNYIFIGGMNGVNYFNPDNLNFNNYSPKVFFTGLKVFNKLVYPKDKTNILKNSLLSTPVVKLKHNQNSIVVGFTVVNYISAGNNVFKYKLEGFDKEWYETNQREVTYSNLNPGSYTLLVTSCNNDGKWSNVTSSLEIIVLSPWWLRWWAIIIWITIIGSVTYYIFRMIWMSQKVEQQLRLEHLEKEQNKQIHEQQIRFFVNISHEFRTPLTLISAPVKEMMESNIADQWFKQQLKYVYKNTQKLMHLVNQFLSFRKAELGFFPLQTTLQEITPLVFDIYSMFEKLAKQKNIDFEFETKTETKLFQIDVNYIERILSNLLSNAFKNTPPSGKIALKVFETTTHLVFEVTDTGVGIPKEKLTHIFERFYQVEQNQYGTGIGLSFVKRLVDLHHGSIAVESDGKSGSSFIVSLPKTGYEEIEKTNKEKYIDIEQVDLDVVAIQNENTEVSTSDIHTYSILIVDDNPDILNYLTDSLHSSYNILKAKHGKEALEILKSQTVDMVITDLMMPEMDGITLCNKIKRNIKFSHIPVIILTAKDEEESEGYGLKMGADDYILKPFVLSILKTKIQNMFAMRERVKAHFQTGEIIDNEKLAFSDLDREFINKAFKTVNDNIDNVDFGVDDFCKAMAISRTGAQQKLRAITGESVVEFIRRIRMEKAIELLKSNRYSIAEISYMVGYNTPSYFTVTFKKFFGYLPNEQKK